MPDFRKEWKKKAEVDYFSPFLSLWLACNSWYKSHYSDLRGNDREFINKIKTDTTGRNHFRKQFKLLIDKDGKDGISFRTNLEMLHYSLENAALAPDKIDRCIMHVSVLDYNDKQTTTDLIKTPTLTATGKVRAADIDDVHRLDEIFITSDFDDCFAGLFEIIYTVRNMLFHGTINPEQKEHDVVRYCYLVL